MCVCVWLTFIVTTCITSHDDRKPAHCRSATRSSLSVLMRRLNAAPSENLLSRTPATVKVVRRWLPCDVIASVHRPLVHHCLPPPRRYNNRSYNVAGVDWTRLISVNAVGLLTATTHVYVNYSDSSYWTPPFSIACLNNFVWRLVWAVLSLQLVVAGWGSTYHLHWNVLSDEIFRDKYCNTISLKLRVLFTTWSTCAMVDGQDACAPAIICVSIKILCARSFLQNCIAHVLQLFNIL